MPDDPQAILIANMDAEAETSADRDKDPLHPMNMFPVFFLSGGFQHMLGKKQNKT